MSPIKSDEQHPFLNLDDNKNKNTDETTPKNGEVAEDLPFPKSANSPKKQQQQRASQMKLDSSEFTVQYLSPLVLRKEFENIIMNSAKRESQECMIDAAFIREHEVIYWNLLWYFKRIGVDTGHLSTILLNARLDELHKKMMSSTTTDNTSNGKAIYYYFLKFRKFTCF